MNRRSRLLYIILITILLFNLSCDNGKDSVSPDDTEPIISENVILPEDDPEITVETIEEDHLTFNFTGDDPDIVENDILMGTADGGYLRKVTSVIVTGNSMEIQTVQAALVEAIVRGSVDTTLSLNFGGSNRGLYGLETKYLRDGVTVRDNGINLSGTELFSGSINGTNVLLTLPTGTITFSPNLDIGFDIDGNQVQEFHAIAGGALEFDFDIRGEFSSAISNFNNDNNPIELASFSQTFIQMVGIVPIVEVVTLSFEAGYSVDIGSGGTIQAGFDSNIAIECGAIWEEGNWSGVWNPSYDFDMHQPEWNEESNVNFIGYVRPSIKVALYAVAGPSINIKPFLRYNGEVVNNPPAWSWELYGGMKSSLGFDISFMSWEPVEFNTELLYPPFEMIIATDSGEGEEEGEQSETVTDIDGNVYNTVVIGNQEWMAENLKVTHYRNGDPIQHTTDYAEWAGLTTGSYCYPVNDFINVDTYGNLYNGYTLFDNRNIAPEGWHVPTDQEWIELEMYLGMSYEEAHNILWRGTNEGGKLKEAGTTHWAPPNTGGTNESGFTALPGGYFSPYGEMGYIGYFWSSTESEYNRDWTRTIEHNSARIARLSVNKQAAHSIRCVRNISPENFSPNLPSIPAPPDGSGDQAVSSELSWVGGDPDGDPVTYNVYLEANDSSPDQLVSSGQSSTTYEPGALQFNTHYYWQIVASDASLSTSGPVWDFWTEEDGGGQFGTVTDIDGNVYNTVIIGDHEWMVENLKVTHYRNGDEIPTGYSNSDWTGLIVGAYSVYDANDDSASQATCDGDCAEVYGNLYNWYAVNDDREVCPTGWHVPSDAAWTELENYLGDSNGGKLKATGTIENGTGLWYDPNTGATNETEFTALPHGYRSYSTGNYYFMGYYGGFWSSTAKDSIISWDRDLIYSDSIVLRLGGNKGVGTSVRCIMDQVCTAKYARVHCTLHRYTDVQTIVKMVDCELGFRKKSKLE